jgi:zinc-binding alcohol dehydrogenase/oxidoreductase
MRAVVLPTIHESLTIQDVPAPQLQSGEARVQLSAAAWNKRDHWISKGKYPGIQTPAILGSDGCGIVIECPDAPDWIGKEVLLCPSLNWGNNPGYQAMNYTILGMPTQGTAATEICVPIGNLAKKPTHLTDVQAAAVPLAGLTAWRAVSTKANVRSGEKVLITGIGGGTAVFAMQFALAKGATVFVTSSSTKKIECAIELGATGGVLYTDEDWTKQLQRMNPRGFDVVIDSAGGEGFGSLIRLLSMGGRLAFFGGTAGKWPTLLPQYMFFKQISILATTMGTPEEFQDMIAFISKHQIASVVDSTFDMRHAQDSLKRLSHPERFGKVTLRIQ